MNFILGFFKLAFEKLFDLEPITKEDALK